MAWLNGGLMLGAAALAAAAPPDTLPVPPTAVDVVVGGARDAQQLEYLVREEYPALRTIEFLMESMSRRGWRLIDVDGFASAPWGEPDSAVPSGLGIHTWSGRWRNEKGRWAGFWLDYRCPMEGSRMHSVWLRVRGGILSPATAQRLEQERQARRDQQRRN